MTKERDEKGRFVPGNQAKLGKTKQSYQQILRDVLDEKTTRKIMKKAAEQAAEGDHQARSWLFGFVMPKLHSVEHKATPEFSSDEKSKSPFDRQVAEQLALIIEEATAEEFDVVNRIMDRIEAKLPTSNPFEDFFERPIDQETAVLFQSMTPEERNQFEELIDKAAERHRTKPVPPMHRLPGPA